MNGLEMMTSSDIETIMGMLNFEPIDKEMAINIVNYVDEIMESLGLEMSYRRIASTTYEASMHPRYYIASYYGNNQDYVVNVNLDSPSQLELKHGNGCVRACPHFKKLDVADANCGETIKMMVTKNGLKKFSTIIRDWE